MSNFLFYFSNIGFEIFFKLKAYTLLINNFDKNNNNL